MPVPMPVFAVNIHVSTHVGTPVSAHAYTQVSILLGTAVTATARARIVSTVYFLNGAALTDVLSKA